MIRWIKCVFIIRWKPSCMLKAPCSYALGVNNPNCSRWLAPSSNLLSQDNIPQFLIYVLVSLIGVNWDAFAVNAGRGERCSDVEADEKTYDTISGEFRLWSQHETWKCALLYLDVHVRHSPVKSCIALLYLSDFNLSRLLFTLFSTSSTFLVSVTLSTLYYLPFVLRSTQHNTQTS